MQMNDVLLESLLHQDEGPTLDFKRDQYAFKKGSSPLETERQRSKLVKDILAFANTKRDNSAFILTGVEEVKGGGSEVLGVNYHLDDEELHDFMNRRTQLPVEFSYKRYTIDGGEIGIIEIPVQDRFLYSRQDYGEVRENTVYIRDGSTTRAATPEEIIEMSTQQRPDLNLSWADSENKLDLSSPFTAHCLLLFPPIPLDTFDLPSSPVPRWNGIEFPSLSHSRPNSDYSLELIVYTCFNAYFTPLGLQLRNVSGVAAKRVRFEGMMTKQKGLEIRDESPLFPEKEIRLFSEIDVLPLSREHKVRVELQEDSRSWIISVEFGDVRAGERVTTIDTLWFRSQDSGIVSLNGKLLGDNIPEPISCSLEIRFESECRPMTVDDVEFYKNAHFESIGLNEE